MLLLRSENTNEAGREGRTGGRVHKIRMRLLVHLLQLAFAVDKAKSIHNVRQCGIR